MSAFNWVWPEKCAVLDLDNTLWGGVIGDDGIGGIRLGTGDPESEAFLAFQGYLKTLRLRGVLLAVCSKNNEATARQVFEQHPEMILRLEDISCFVANWNDKPSNIRTIAKELNIGLNSLVFIDDNPAERAIVRQFVPEVAVPELPEDVTRDTFKRSIGSGTSKRHQSALKTFNARNFTAPTPCAVRLRRLRRTWIRFLSRYRWWHGSNQ